MSEPLLTVLKFCLLALLYLFLLRVLRAVWMEVRTPVLVGAQQPAIPVPSTPAPQSVPRSPAPTVAPTHLVVIDPPTQSGASFSLNEVLTIGRAAGCTLVVPDDFVSQLHTRVSRRDHHVVVEDLGSTNGTFVNGRQITTTTVMERGDHLQVGNTIMELQ